ncbi:DUF262 domain-containing protein [Campylobacter lari]|uniref:DUF262 domain-containing protein n=1 Tax=Campylobacter sp. CNRCH_2007_0968H TaxID=2911598 RepID=UPI001279DDBC|nr:DUF262 domain-containing protein [Campylobacter sp. CNRCH_2007_0968H]EAJ5677274.1 DUF262 domain-containing protein [Campylobacter lari]EAK0443808.1 DUF262 domain-containing protein [Campylobacter lari]EAK9942399.1 DUF262 domain-containing protein [Campylobacter lari]MCV3529868.1 DUF262 domain-containing protein [Campylobacter sp. CNRCH_2007_0968H]
MANNSTNNQNQASVINIENIVNINDKKQSIFFEIPPYQRLYEWDKEQIQTLLNDIKTNESKNEYFIGNVVVSQKDDKYLLIDGQQRLTTLFLIGFYLSYKKYNDWQNFIINDNKLRVSMPIREKEEKVLKEFAKFCSDKKDDNNLFLQEIKKFPQDICQNIPQALEAIVNWFKENIKEENIKEFSNFIYKKVNFVFVELAQNTDLNRFFIRMNNRGKQLEKHEILKARLLSKITNKDEKTLYAHIWDICSQMDNYIFQKASDRKISELDESNKDTIDTIIKESFDKPNQDKENQGKFKSIVDFPTFLLHVYKICNKQDIAIDKNKLLEIIKIEQKEIEQKAKKFIENLLKYRILFDYFVIKSQDDMENSYKIRRLTKKYSTYTISEDSNVMPDLAMVQNYLRVARSGMSNNHHHWLTPFLKKLDNYFSNFKSNNIISEIVKFFSSNFNITSEKFENNVEYYIKLLINNDNLKEFYKNTQSDLIHFLEILDTALAKEQASIKDDKNDLLVISNFTEEDIPNLDRGTATLHYWFYRLEYYLWKNAEVNGDKVKICGKEMDKKKFDNFYFRSLNSIEHVQAQSKANENDWTNENIDNFGNLALISSSFNSSLNNHDVPSKYRDFQKRYMDNKKAVISLKLWLIYALANKDGEDKIAWTFGKAQEHKSQMLEVLKNSFESN